MGEKDGVTSGASGLVRWGIVGAGNIAHRFARSLANEPRSELTAISCRSAAKATAFALEHGVATEGALSDEALGGVAGSAHAALLARPDVDAVYVALPHHLHAEWVVAALRAGKAVLCEKPLCVSPEETALLTHTAHETQALLMEGMKTRFLPLYRRVRELVGQGTIGRLTRVEAVLQNAMLDRILRGGDYLSSPSGGGMLLDTGVYCASWIEDYLSGPFEVASAEARWEAGVDCAVDAELRFGEKTARLLAAADRDNTRYTRLVGTEGQIVVDQPHRPTHARLERAGEKPMELVLPLPVDDLYGEIEHFVDLLIDGRTESPVMPLAASQRCADMLGAIGAAIRGDSRKG